MDIQTDIPVSSCGAMTVAMLILAPACRRSGEDKEIKDLSQKAAELDKLSQQANTAGAEQTRKLKEAGVNDVRPNAATLQLTEEQKPPSRRASRRRRTAPTRPCCRKSWTRTRRSRTSTSKIARLRAGAAQARRGQGERQPLRPGHALPAQEGRAGGEGQGAHQPGC